jgi:signal transduction histidine kinase
MTTTPVRLAPVRAAAGRETAFALVAVGLLSAVVLVLVAAGAGLVTVTVAAVIPVSWLVAGALAVRARPDHPGARLLTAVGSSHLLAFALSLTVGRQADPTGWLSWSAAVVAGVLFALGFAALATLLANYPHGTSPTRAFAPVACTVAALASLAEAVTHDEMPLVLGARSSAVPAPSAAVLLDLPFSFYALVPLLVVVGAAVLVRRGRTADGDLRRQLSWAVGAGGIIALLLLATPAAAVLVPDPVWAAIFVAGAAAIPFVLLAGLVRYRLMDVDVYVGRTMAKGLVLVAVVSVYAVAATLAPLEGPLAVGVVLLAVLTGGPLIGWTEEWVDRHLTGGRVRGRALVRHLVDALESTSPGQVAQRAADTVAEGLEVGWVRVVLEDGPSADAGSRTGSAEPTLVVPLVGAGTTVGRMECGPRHGGWSEDEIAQVRLLARHAALALHTEQLTAALAEQVDQLRASRSRLVHAEQEVRRRLERDLHDGVQQQLVALLSRLGALEVLLEPGTDGAQFTALAKRQAEMSLTELRELIRGIHPPLLADRGLVAAIRSRANLLPLPVEVITDETMRDARLASATEAAAYYVASEALTNVLKHASARSASVAVSRTAGLLQIRVTDDGVGLGASPTGDGSGLAGLRDRVEALGGELLTSTGPGTTVTALLPVEAADV